MPVANRPHETLIITPLHVPGGRRLQFASIITDFTDQWTQNWNSTNVYGRMDPVSFYGGTRRELTLAFDVRGDDGLESARNMRNIQTLIQYQYPRYRNPAGEQRTIIAPPYFAFRFLNMLNSGGAYSRTLTGYINGSIQVKPGFGDKNTSIHFDDNENPTAMYASLVNISMRIQVLHVGDLVGWSSPFSLGQSYPYGVDKEDIEKLEKRNEEANRPAAQNVNLEAEAAPPVTPPVTTDGGTKVDAAKNRSGASIAERKETAAVEAAVDRMMKLAKNAGRDRDEIRKVVVAARAAMTGEVTGVRTADKDLPTGTVTTKQAEEMFSPKTGPSFFNRGQR